MNRFMIKCLSNTIFKYIGVRRLANFAAISIGPKIVDHTVSTISGGYIPVPVVRILRTSLSYAPVAVVMGTAGTTGGLAPIVSALTYYILVQVSETLCMVLVREATGATFRGVKYVVSSAYNTVTGKDRKDEKMVDEELKNWVFLEKEELDKDEISPERVKEVEDYFNSIELEELGVDNENNNHINKVANNSNGSKNIELNSNGEQVIDLITSQDNSYEVKDPIEMEKVLTDLNNSFLFEKQKQLNNNDSIDNINQEKLNNNNIFNNNNNNIRSSNNLDDFVLL
ncbi:hypothetical protein DICPUDRAFT_56486 [Dictyostelium purpureum]|uniref:Uncharacterized protein n=1 Tax=Dictyostelium purpureum TaxID=5786 RepID=F0ZRU8_DICPU|nr:uncharacterized protein DICPUDRAFT_56486 [Dictyostelium purpureum]EGC33324.1 hypothetical protein DICPUDRAFT_56486 [Dictyostelium purpureum]|eukprot:XP_003290140.1 hypothetical protein DICPUDRAFT_56486 [Dictyostelium purpureum]